MTGVAVGDGEEDRGRARRGTITTQWRASPSPPRRGRDHGAVVEPFAQLLAGLEERDVLLADLDAVAGARIAALAARRGASPRRRRSRAARPGRRATAPR